MAETKKSSKNSDKHISYEEYYSEALKLNKIHAERVITPEKLLEMKKNKEAIIIDVRNKESYECGHIEGAINIPLTDITEKTLAKAAPNKESPIIIYCDAALETFMTRKIALTTKTFPLVYQLGYENIYELQEGLKSVDQLISLPFIIDDKKLKKGKGCDWIRDIKRLKEEKEKKS